MQEEIKENFIKYTIKNLVSHQTSIFQSLWLETELSIMNLEYYIQLCINSKIQYTSYTKWEIDKCTFVPSLVVYTMQHYYLIQHTTCTSNEYWNTASNSRRTLLLSRCPRLTILLVVYGTGRPPYSPDLSPCNYIFQHVAFNLQMPWKGCHIITTPTKYKQLQHWRLESSGM